MTILQELDKKITQVGNNVAQKAQSMTQNMKTKSEIDEEQRKITSLYAEIGRMFAHTLTAENIPTEYRQTYNWIRISEQKITGIRGRMTAQAVAYDDRMTCPVCHAQIPADSAFCNGCGANLAQAAVPRVEFSEQPPEVRTPKEANFRSACANCGSPLKDGQIFCINCGSKVETAPAAPLSGIPRMDENDKTEIITPEPIQEEVFCIHCGTRIKE